MKAILLITDSEAVRDYERVLLAEGHQGFTVLPAVAGSGRQGLKLGDRVHPGSSSLLLTIVAEAQTPALLERLVQARDDRGHAASTRMWTFAVDEVV